MKKKIWIIINLILLISFSLCCVNRIIYKNRIKEASSRYAYSISDSLMSDTVFDSEDNEAYYFRQMGAFDSVYYEVIKEGSFVPKLKYGDNVIIFYDKINNERIENAKVIYKRNYVIEFYIVIFAIFTNLLHLVMTLFRKRSIK